MCVRGRVERKREMDIEMKVNEDITPRPERLLNLSNEGSLHLSSERGDGRMNQV